ncbi:hypothetical protein MVEN_00961400 [Mycena venus]|uniref:Uncharacterized protein n=1 Tax=Mycena venus TaxID=2733690 RepID=A0A8H6Y8I6_9AGAR|nr:hypothetical protein MVEN_00961400 [Mycena venus]
MPLVKGLVDSIVNYRLGYAPTRPYTWRWTTPVAFGVFLVATIILALINVPLSAYTIVSEATYTPQCFTSNASIKRSCAIIRPNGSIYNYIIEAAYDGFDTSRLVSSFSYYSNPLSDSCDVTTMTIHAQSGQIQVSAKITCWTPTVYILSIDISSILSSTDTDDIRFTSLDGFYVDLYQAWFMWGLAVNGTIVLPDVQVPTAPGHGDNLTEFEMTVRPCCDCHGNGDATWNTGIFSLDYPPCTEAPASFLAFDGTVVLDWGSRTRMRNNTDFFFTEENIFNGTAFAGLNTILHNLFQALYHTIRLDLGISQPNQIYTSADMYNRSISTVYLPGIFLEGVSPQAYANTSRRDSSNLTMLWTAEQQDVPLGAAITSVFVSTFAMVSVLWHVFCFIAAALSGSGSGKSIVTLAKYTFS